MTTKAIDEALDALLTYGESDLAMRARAELEALRREAINEALEEAATEILSAKGNMSAWRASRIIRRHKKGA